MSKRKKKLTKKLSKNLLFFLHFLTRYCKIRGKFRFSYAKALNDNLTELNQIANQHEFVAQCYQESILSTIPPFVRNLKEERKMVPSNYFCVITT